MKNVVIYSSDTCGYCTMAKDYLKEKGIAFTEKNVSHDIEARKELIAKGLMGVPVIYIDDQLVHGFDKPQIDKLLGL